MCMAQIDTTHIERIVLGYTTVVGYGVIRHTATYDHNGSGPNRLSPTKSLKATYHGIPGALPMSIDESQFVEELAKLERSEYVPFEVTLADTALVGQMDFFFPNLREKGELDTIKAKCLIKELAGKSEQELEDIMTNCSSKYLIANSIRDYSWLNVYYTNDSYLSFRTHRSSPFSLLLFKTGPAWGDRVGTFIKVNDKDLQLFYEALHLEQLATFPDRDSQFEDLVEAYVLYKAGVREPYQPLPTPTYLPR